MNTNYSKIALLLALGVAAGKVGAFDGIRLKSLSNESSLDDIKNAGEAFAKINVKNKNLDNIKDHIKSYTKAKTDGLVAEPGVDTALSKFLTSRTATENAIKLIETFASEVQSDITNIFKQSPVVAEAIKYQANTKDELNALLSIAQSDVHFSALFKDGSSYKTLVEAIDKIKYSNDLSPKLAELIGEKLLKISKSGFMGTESVAKFPDATTVDMTELQNKIKFGLNSFVANVETKLSNLTELSDNDVATIVKGGKQYDAYKGIIGTLNLMPGGEGLIESKISSLAGTLDTWFNSFDKDTAGTAAAKLNGVLMADQAAGGTGALKKAAFMNFLNEVFGQNKLAVAGGGGPVASAVFRFQDAVGGGGATANEVTNDEAAYAGFGQLAAAADTDLSTDNSAAGAVDLRGKIYDNLMKPIMEFIKSGKNAYKKQERIAARNQRTSEFKSLLNTKDFGNRPRFSKPVNDSELSSNELTEYLSKLKDYVSSNKGKPDFAKEKDHIKQDLSNFMTAFSRLHDEKTKFMSDAEGKIDAQGVFKSKTRADADHLKGRLKETETAILKELGDVGSNTENKIVKTIATVENVAELLGLEDIVSNKLNAAKITEIAANRKVADLIKGLKDTEAQNTFNQMYKSLVKGNDDKVTEADVKALKELFSLEVQAMLNEESKNQYARIKEEDRKAKIAADKEEKERKERELAKNRSEQGKREGLGVKNVKAISEAIKEELENTVTDYLDPKTGEEIKDGDEAEKSLEDFMNALKAIKSKIQTKNRRNAKVRNRTLVSAAKEIIDSELEKFKSSSVESDNDSSDDNNSPTTEAVSAARAVITEKVEKAFEISLGGKKAGKGQGAKAIRRNVRARKGNLNARKGNLNAGKGNRNAGKRRPGGRAGLRRSRAAERKLQAPASKQKNKQNKSSNED